MRKALVFVAACTLVGALAISPASGYNTPKQAKRVYTELVTAYNECSPDNAPLTHRPSLAFPACPPVQSSANNGEHILGFSSFGAMTYEFKAKTGDIGIKATGRGVYDKGSPFVGTLTVTAAIRVTDNGCGAASSYDTDCTTDVPFPIAMTCINSFCFLENKSFDAILPGALSVGDQANIEIGPVVATDPDGDAFARSGLLVR